MASACGQVAGVHRSPDLRQLLVPVPGSGSTSRVIQGTGGHRYRIVVVIRTRQQGGAATQAPPTTYGRWAALFLQSLGAPVCRNNLVTIVAWEVAEGSRAAWNPLDTTLAFPGSTDFNSAGVKNYPTLADGLQATVATLQRSPPSYGYGPVVAALAACADPVQTALAIDRSLWCRGCASGRYVIGLIAEVAANYR